MISKNKGFTLVELLVVISILGVLATIALGSFRSSQARGRDAERKSDLKQIVSSLELYYADHGKYPVSVSGSIGGCPSTSQSACTWGSGQFTDTKTVYFKVIPKDPLSAYSYYYRIVDAGTYQKFQLFAHLENTKDPSIILSSPYANNCGSVSSCNFSITSPNTTPSE